jgi:hypothetical protein
MTDDRLADRLARAARSLARCYPELFEASVRGQGVRERQSANRNDPPGPSRVEVLDLQRQVNTAALERHAQALNTLGFAPAGVADVRYRQSPLVPEALGFLERVAPSLARADPELAADAADEFGELAAEARRLLGLSEHGTRLEDMACPEWIDDDGSLVCEGDLVAYARRGVIVCQTCGKRTYDQDWEALGRTARRIDPAARPKEAA